ncbi:MAG: RsmB/NOP family class I SAM-dependent RNA methyltransferase [Verrucomicrobia bacterium]|nr:RsmB/NOP family class I SAM-dependent RNA methyltransferase [Verrucomicrobiota bacterium]
MSVADSQRRVCLQLLAQLRPHWRRDPALPDRIQRLLAANRHFGGRDRRLYRELIYTTLRFLPWIEPLLDHEDEEAVRRLAWLAADTPDTQAFRQAFAMGEAPTGDRAQLLPAWFEGHCPEVFAGSELEAQCRRAPLWVRLQTADANAVFNELVSLGCRLRRSAALPDAVEVQGKADLTATVAWRAGRFEVQDLGSQMVLGSVGVEPGGRWLDACAGAGGKSLQLARLLGPTGRVDAHDIRPAALTELRSRAARARLDHIHPCSRLDAAGYDGVLVDAPCSGSGTWRRAPHLKWITSEALVARKAEIQRVLLRRLAALVRPSGRLVYATCSLSRRENQDVLAAFLAEHPQFHRAPFADTFGFDPQGAGLTIWPARHDSDGYFVASLRRA